MSVSSLLLEVRRYIAMTYRWAEVNKSRRLFLNNSSEVGMTSPLNRHFADDFARKQNGVALFISIKSRDIYLIENEEKYPRSLAILLVGLNTTETELSSGSMDQFGPNGFTYTKCYYFPTWARCANKSKEVFCKTYSLQGDTPHALRSFLV